MEITEITVSPVTPPDITVVMDPLATDVAAAVLSVTQAGETAVEAVEAARDGALTDVGTARSGALTDVGNAQTNATGAVTAARDQATGVVATARGDAITAIEQQEALSETAVLDQELASVDAVEEEGDAQVAAVNAAGATQTGLVQAEGAAQVALVGAAALSTAAVMAISGANPARWTHYDTARRAVAAETSLLGQPADAGGNWEHAPSYGAPNYSPRFGALPDGRILMGGGGSGDALTRFYLLSGTVAGDRLLVSTMGFAAQPNWGLRLCLAYVDASNHLTVVYHQGGVQVIATMAGTPSSLASQGAPSTSLDYSNSGDLRRLNAGIYTNHPNASTSAHHVSVMLEGWATALRVGLTTEVYNALVVPAARVGVGCNASTAYLYDFAAAIV